LFPHFRPSVFQAFLLEKSWEKFMPHEEVNLGSLKRIFEILWNLAKICDLLDII
jgi:hypothetical protein